MPEESWLESAVAEDVIREAVARVIKQYRLTEDAAREQVEETFSKTQKLREVFESATNASQVLRTRAYADALATAKRNTYYALRRYAADEVLQKELTTRLAQADSREAAQPVALELAQLHASTRERFAERDAFYTQLAPLIGEPESILDVGCGVHPLLFPFETSPSLRLYLAADRDAASIATVQAYSACLSTKLIGMQWDAAGGWPAIQQAAGIETFDVALLFKVVPVVERQKPELLEVLARTPARRLLVSGSRISLTKRQDIERRERGSIRRFCEQVGGTIVGEFSVGEEFVMALQR